MPTLESKFETLKNETRVQWKAWAEQLADGGAAPSPLDILEAGAVLDIDSPMAALRADADALLEVRTLEARAAEIKQNYAEQLAPFGGEAGLRERIGELRRELARLQGLAGPEKYLQAGRLSGDAGRLRQKHPRVFRDPQAKVSKKGARK
jgi:hypothetical protein